MDRFTKDQMFDELRTIFLFEADHILMGAGEEMAERFIGFPLGGETEFLALSPSKVDLSRFTIAGSFDRGYDYAFRPSLTNTLDESEVQDLVVFMLGTPRTGGIGSGGTQHRFMTADGYCQTVADTVLARWKLEWDVRMRHEFTTRDLALLANMTEGAVRNAMADKTENGLRASPGVKPVRVEYDEAKRWLSNRRGFIPTPSRPREDAVLHEMVAAAKTTKDLGQVIRRRSYVFDINNPPDLASAGFTAEEIKAWEDGSFEFDVGKAARLAEELDLDPPLFVGKALEVSLRRNCPVTEGGQA